MTFRRFESYLCFNNWSVIPRRWKKYHRTRMALGEGDSKQRSVRTVKQFIQIETLCSIYIRVSRRYGVLIWNHLYSELKIQSIYTDLASCWLCTFVSSLTFSRFSRSIESLAPGGRGWFRRRRVASFLRLAREFCLSMSDRLS